MTRSTHQSFRLKELDGGLNFENSPNEIENKQAVKCTNFNFQGNKLVSSKKGALAYTSTGTIIAEGEIDGKVYWLNDSGLYVDGVRQTTEVYAFYSDVAIVAGTTYTITLNGTSYSYTATAGDVAEPVPELVIMQELQTLIEAAGFSTKIADLDRFTTNQYASLFVWGTITTVSDVNLKRDSSEWMLNPPSDRITNGIIMKNLFDIIIIGGSPFYLQYLDDGVYFVQHIETNAKVGTTYGGKLIVSDGTDKMYFSVSSNITMPFLVKNFGVYDGGAQIVGEGGGQITGIVSGENGIYVFKKNEVYYSNSTQGDGTTLAFVFNKITNNGAENQKAITKVGQEIFYFDGVEKHLRRLSYEQNLTTLRDTAISLPLTDALSTYSNVTLNYLYPNISIFSDGKDTLSYNVDVKSFTYNTGVVGKGFGSHYYNGLLIYNTYAAYNTSGEWRSKEFDLGDAIDIKRLSEVETYGVIGAGQTVEIDVYVDGTLYETRQVYSNYTGAFRNRFDLWYEGRMFQIGIRYIGAGKLEINELSFKYKTIRAFDIY